VTEPRHDPLRIAGPLARTPLPELLGEVGWRLVGYGWIPGVPFPIPTMARRTSL